WLRGALPARIYACCQVDYGEYGPYYSGAELSASMQSRKSHEWWVSDENLS
ncbi:hypothetical protein M405DRAFT_809113, partial [Rhizopogon salebrosus TDB-379]